MLMQSKESQNMANIKLSVPPVCSCISPLMEINSCHLPRVMAIGVERLRRQMHTSHEYTFFVYHPKSKLTKSVHFN